MIFNYWLYLNNLALLITRKSLVQEPIGSNKKNWASALNENFVYLLLSL